MYCKRQPVMQQQLRAFRKRAREEGAGELRLGQRLPLASLSPTQLRCLQEDLTFQPRSGFDKAVQPEPVACYALRHGSVTVPRCYELPPGLGPSQDRLSDGEPLSAAASFRGELRPQQVEAAERSLASLRQAPHACILTLPCGYGKTVVSLRVATGLGRRTLVCVHKEFLLEQWAERIREFLPGATVGRLQGATAETHCDFVVAMIQSLATRDYGDAKLDVFGTVVVDEAHHMAARVFSEIFYRLPARHVLGLTATPKRKDGCTAILHLHMGPHSLVVEQRSEEEVRVQALAYRSAARVSRDIGPGETQRYKTMLTRDARRNGLLADVCARAVAAGRCVICLTDRVQHARDLLALFQARGGAAGHLYVGGLKRAERSEAEAEGRALFATFSMAKEGLDIPRLDTLVLASPASDLTQTVGRILRPCGSKQRPLIYDVADDLVLPFVRMNQARRRFYAASGYVVVEGAEGAEGLADVA